MDINDLRTGIIIKANNWKEPIEVKRVEELGNYVRIIGSTIESRSHIDQLISIEEIDSLIIDKVESKFNSPCAKFFLAFEARRFRYASLYDPLLAINISKVDALPHQIEAVYGYILKLPRIRFLIADDPGAGKTIMAGLIIKELKLRNLIKRVLIIVPGHLKDQWRRELKDRFKESFVVMDRAFINAHYGENAWEREHQIITSMDFAKRDDIIPSIISTYFDLVVVDEAHKMSAYKYGEQTHKTGRYKLGEVVSKNSENLLFLTATPHRGDPENFRLFLDLLEPGFFATQQMLEDSIKNKDNPLFIRRIKEDLKDFEGKPLFLPRNIQTLSFRLSDDEKILYNDVSKYVKVQYNNALAKDGRRYIAFALVILQRRLASSTYALLKSLERRKEKLETIMKKAESIPVAKVKIFDFDEVEDMSEEERWKEEEMWETLSVAENRDELKREIQTLENLIEQAIEIVRSEEEVKLTELKKTLEKLNKEFTINEKIIIFTEARDTLEYLVKKLNVWGYSVNTIHGGMKLESRIEAESIFKNEKQVLVATEAAGEGINLQFCHLMINYDIPWNPNRLEQRMGRIHRYGQNKEVFIFNLVAADTREGRVITRLFEKLQEIKKALGSDKVFDVINEIIYGKNLAQLLLEAAASARDIEQILSEIDIEVDEEYISKVKESLGESLATRFIDYTRIKEMADKAREFKLIPEYTEAFFKKAFLLLEGKYRERKDGFLAIDRIPYELKIIAEEDSFRRKYGKLLNRYPKITFDKDIAFKNPDVEFISFDHPLFESILEYISRNFNSDLRNGTVFIDPSNKLNGYILIYEGEIRDGLGKTVGKKLFTIFTNDDEVKSVSPTILWDLAEGKTLGDTINIKELEGRIIGNVISLMEQYKNEKHDERINNAKIKEKYGIKSLEYLIVKLDGDIISLFTRKENGELVDLPIRNKELQKRRYEAALEDLKEQINLEKTLTMDMPKFIGILRIKPYEKLTDGIRSTEEIELIGMKVSMDYERENGRIPEDVSKDTYLGYDIRSTDTQGKKRYIEVKARAQIGSIAITQNEWFKAKRFGEDFYLYVVFNATTRPELFMIRNPAEHLNPNEKLEIVRYIVPIEQIKEKGEKSG